MALKPTQDQKIAGIASDLIRHHIEAATRSRNTLLQGINQADITVTGDEIRKALGQPTLELMEKSNALILD